MPGSWWRENIDRILILTFLSGLIVIIFSQQMEFTSLDLGRHLANGRHLWQQPVLLFENFYSYTEPTWPFINHHWLAGIIFYALYSWFGFSGLSSAGILLWLITFGLAFYLALRRANFYVTALVFAPALLLLSERVDFRPENFSYLFLLLVWLLIERAGENKNFRFLVWLLPLFIIWVNTHIYFFLGLALLGFKAVAVSVLSLIRYGLSFRSARESGSQFSSALLAAALSRAWQASRFWWRALFWSILVCLINPNTWRGLLYPLNILREYGYQVAENKSIFFLNNLILNANFGVVKILLPILLLSWVVYFLLSRKLRLWELILSLFFSALALFAARNLALWALVFGIITARNLSPLGQSLFAWLKKRWGDLTDKWFKAAKILFLLSLLILNIYLFFDHDRQRYFLKKERGWGLAAGSEESAEFFKSHGLSGPIFNNYDLGSALVFWLYPAERVFVDNRPEAYSVSFFQDIYLPIQTEPAVWLEQAAHYGFKTVYFSHTDSTPWARQFLRFILSSPDWRLVYFDRYTVILLANLPEAQEDNEEASPPTISPAEFRSRLRALATDSNFNGRVYLAGLAELAGQADLSREIYRSILLDRPDNREALASLGFLYSSQLDQSSQLMALTYFERARQAGYDLPALGNQEGLVYWQLGDYRSAAQAWQAVLKRDQNNASARHYLSELERLERSGQIPALK